MRALLDLNHREARRLIASGAPVFLTVNPVEYHGPHLSLHNDHLVSLGLCRALQRRIAPDAPFLFAGELDVGVDPCPGPGTRSTPYARVRKLVVDACRALAQLGAKQVVLMTFHGPPLHALAIEAGVRMLRKSGVRALAPFNAVVQELLTLDPARYQQALAPISDPKEREAAASGLRLDFHAGFFETSMALHLAPESVSPLHRELPPCPNFRAPAAMTVLVETLKRLGARSLASELEFAAAAFGWYALRPFPGYTGSPHLASAESGAAFCEAIVARYVELASEVFAGRAESPRPIMRWSPALTLGGRFGTPGVSEREVARMAALP